MDYPNRNFEELQNELHELQLKYNSLKTAYDNDISGRKQVEVALQYSEDRFRLIVEQAPIAMAIVSMDGAIEYINSKAIKVFGYSLEDIPTMDRWWEQAYPDENYRTEVVAEWMGRVYKAIAEGNEILGNEYTATCKDGTMKTMFISGVIVADKVFVLFDDITDRKKAETELRNSIEIRELIFRISPDAALITRLSDGLIADFNERFVTISGYTKEEIVGKTTIELNLYENNESRQRVVEELEKYGYCENVEIIFNTKNGYKITGIMSSQIVNLYDAPHVYSIIRDITERKLAEETQKQTASLLRATLESTADGILVVDMNGKVSSFNKKFEELWHIPKNILDTKDDEKLLGYIVDQLSDPEKFLSKVQELYSQPDMESFDTIDFKDGRIFERYSLPQKIDEKIVGRVWSFRDITERKIIEHTLKENELRFKAISEQAMDGITLVDLNGNYNLVNQAFCKMIGYTEEELYQMNVMDLKPPAERSYTFEETIKTGKASFNSIKLQCKDKSIIYTDINGQKIVIDNEQYVLGIIRNVTERVLREEELIAAKEKAEESDRLKTAFLQNMSHEIRTPMNAIMGFSELMVEYCDNKPKLEQFSEIINIRCNDLLSIINDILDIAKIESGQVSINLEKCNLSDLFSELTDFFKEHQIRIQKQHINFQLHAFCNSSENTIVTDKVKLKQIFINLISNAFKFTNTGTIIGGCKYGTDKNLIFYVEDTGIGIPSDKFNLIFERFAQLKTNKSLDSGGTGLGLSIVKGLVELLGGNIWLESELQDIIAGKPGRTAFYFKLPYKISPSESLEIINNIESDVFHFSGKTILVVEDDIYNAAYIKEILSNTGLNIIHTENGLEAVQLAKTQLPDLVLMDIRLPDITGYEAINLIKQHNPDLKIIVQTAYAAHDDRQKAINAGCVDYISKPIKRNLLLSIISNHLKNIYT
jgi:PAS domain S-box-containing protein